MAKQRLQVVGLAPAAPSPTRTAAAAPRAPRAAAPSNSATTATSAASATPTAPAAPAAPSNDDGQLHVAANANVRLIEEMEGGETDVGHFLLAENETLIGRDVVRLRAIGNGYCGCRCASRQRKTQSGKCRHGGSFGCASLPRDFIYPCHDRILRKSCERGNFAQQVCVFVQNATWCIPFLFARGSFDHFRRYMGFGKGSERHLLPQRAASPKSASKQKWRGARRVRAEPLIQHISRPVSRVL